MTKMDGRFILDAGDDEHCTLFSRVYKSLADHDLHSARVAIDSRIKLFDLRSP